MSKDDKDIDSILGQKESHESYGMVGFSRYTVGGGGQSFFGSAIKSATGISLTIRTADRRRSLNNDHIYGDKPLIEVNLSPNQFADLITSLNQGDGVPCTIRWFGGRYMEEPPATHLRQLFNNEFKEDVEKTLADAEKGLKSLKTLLEKPSLGKKDREEIFKVVEGVVRHVANGMPFVQKQFNEAMDKVVTAARAEVEAFIEGKIRSVGISTLQEEARKALAPVGQSPVLLEGTVVEKKE